MNTKLFSGPIETPELLAQVTAPHFVAGLLLSGDVVTGAAPILRYMIGWDRAKVRGYCRLRDWQVRIVRGTSEATIQ